MKKLPRFLLVLLTLLVLVSAADAAGKKKKAPPKPRGTVIASVSADSITITENAVSKTFAITQFTEVLFKGQRSTLAALQPGMAVSVTLASDPTKASRINASDPPVAHPTK
ncbi:MAG: hypothetical protein ABIR71_03270 [Chthoniobacterales bacterium]